MKIAAAGATGFLGRHICKALTDAGHSVTAITRDPRKLERIPELAGADAVRGDVTDPSSLAGTMDGADAFVGAVGFPNYPNEKPRKALTFDRYERVGTDNLLAEATRAGVRRYVYLSGVGADPSSDKNWYRAKGAAEDAISASGIEHCILRPSWAYGPGDRALNRFASIARLSPVVPKPGVRVQRIQPVYVGDIATAVRAMFDTEECWGRRLEIGGPDVLTMDEVMTTLFEVMGVKRWIVPVPAPIMKVATAPLTLLPKPPLTPGGVDFAVQDGIADTGEFRAVLGIEPVPLRDGLSRYMTPKR